ncbi:hypothetical protein JT359_19950 [Candidatus Poribacteria bacterium]|nr:hypothetical protein [Candidatus Poribacteria bacterium]
MKRSDPKDERYYKVLISHIESIKSGTSRYAPLSEVKRLNEMELDVAALEFERYIDQEMDKFMRELYPVSD